MPTTTKSADPCGKCSRPMPTERRHVPKGEALRVHINGVTMEKFYFGHEADLNFCVRCKTYTFPPREEAGQSP